MYKFPNFLKRKHQHELVSLLNTLGTIARGPEFYFFLNL